MHDHEWDNPELAADIERDHPPLTPVEEVVIKAWDRALAQAVSEMRSLGLSTGSLRAILEKAGR